MTDQYVTRDELREILAPHGIDVPADFTPSNPDAPQSESGYPIPADDARWARANWATQGGDYNGYRYAPGDWKQPPVKTASEAQSWAIKRQGQLDAEIEAFIDSLPNPKAFRNELNHDTEKYRQAAYKYLVENSPAAFEKGVLTGYAVNVVGWQ